MYWKLFSTIFILLSSTVAGELSVPSLSFTATAIPYETVSSIGIFGYQLQTCIYDTGIAVLYGNSMGDVWGLNRSLTENIPELQNSGTYGGPETAEIIFDCHSILPIQAIYRAAGFLIHATVAANGNLDLVPLDSDVTFQQILNMNTKNGAYVLGFANDGVSSYLYDLSGTRMLIATTAVEDFFEVDSSFSFYGKAVKISQNLQSQLPVLSVFAFNMTASTYNVAIYDYQDLVGRSVIQNYFADYDNVMYWAFVDQSTFSLNIQTVPPSSLYYVYEEEITQHGLVALGDQNHIVVFGATTANGTVILGTWDTTKPKSEVNITRIGTGLSAFSGFNPFSMAKISYNQLQISFSKTGLFGWTITYSGEGLNVTQTITPTVVSPPTATTPTNITLKGNDTFAVTQPITVEQLTLDQNSTLIVQHGATITVTGCANLAGNLRVVLSNGTIVEVIAGSEIEILVLNATCRNGEFNSVQTTNYDLEDCEELIGKPNYSPAQLTLIITVDSSSCGGSDLGYDQTALFIGVCVGGGAVLIVGILLLSFYFSPLRAKVFPYARSK